jgi:hypothetical protein
MGPFAIESTWKVYEQWVGWFVYEYARINTLLLVRGVMSLFVIIWMYASVRRLEKRNYDYFCGSSCVFCFCGKVKIAREL